MYIGGRHHITEVPDMSVFKKKENKVRVLFVDAKNDFASQMGEYFTMKFFPDKYEAYSAGPEPDIVDCELISAMYQNGEDMRRQVSKDFENEDYLPKDKTYDFVIYTEKEVFDKMAAASEWKGKQILAPMRQRLEFEATDDLELYQEYVRSMEEVREWVKENMADPSKLPSMVSA